MTNSESLESRLSRLENENRRLRRGGLALAVVLGIVPILAFALPDEPQDASFRIVDAGKFVLRDSRTGKVRGTFAHQTREGGWAGLTLWDGDGRPRAEFKLWEDGTTSLSMTDAERGVKARLGVDAEGVPSLSVNGRPVATN